MKIVQEITKEFWEGTQEDSLSFVLLALGSEYSGFLVTSAGYMRCTGSTF